LILFSELHTDIYKVIQFTSELSRDWVASSFVFWRPRVHISTQRPDISSCRNSPQSLQKNLAIVDTTKIKRISLPSTSFFSSLFINHPIVWYHRDARNAYSNFF
jgi:hypothetical protein